MKDLDLFRGKRVLVTGDTGFKGSWLSCWLRLLGADVVGYALPAGTQDLFRLLSLDRKIHHVNGDIRDGTAFHKVCRRFKPEFLFHLAAQSLVRVSHEDPKRTFDVNVGGSVNVLEAARRSPSLRALIYVTSDKCYENKEWVWGYRERDRLGGRDPYSASKAAAEMVFAGYRESFFRERPRFGLASVRAGNVIGGGDWSADRLIPDCVRALLRGRPIVLRNPSSTRPWQHVLDPLYGYLLLASRLHARPGNYSGSWNFGPREDAARTVRQVAERVVACWGTGRIQVKADKLAPQEANWLHLNCDKAHLRLGWRPRWDFERAVTETVRWYRDTARRSPAAAPSNEPGRPLAAALAERQIREYTESRP